VREIRAAGGDTVYLHRPEPVRRAVSPAIAARLREYLRSAAGTEGTGSRAQLAGYQVLGKTGTARMIRNGRYVTDAHTASFAAIFPADDPQLVIVVKVDDPKRGGYYGGITAAPVIGDMLRQALAAEQVALDRTRLVAASAAPPPDSPAPAAPRSVRAAVVAWPLRPSEPESRPDAPVPPVDGAPLREAVRTLHQAGLQVRLVGTGATVRRVDPQPGATLARGAMVTVWTDE
jgi:membrane peptidoglycan carboxypeptidase